MSLTVDLAIEEPRWETVADVHMLVERAVGRAHALSAIRLLDEAEVSVLLCDDVTVQGLNRTWRGKDKPTNVLSFPASSPLPLSAKPLLGDIAVAFETTRREADEENKTLADHLSHLVVHGFLHLIGHDHETPAEAETMEAIETRVLAALGIDDPYAGSEPAPTGAP